MRDERTLSTSQLAARLGVSRETVNQYAQTLETTLNTNFKGHGGARRFGETELEIFSRMRQALRAAPGGGLEVACRQALEFARENSSPEVITELSGQLIETFQNQITTLETLQTQLEQLLTEAGDFREARDRLEQTIDDCGTEVMEITGRLRHWPGQLERFEAGVKHLADLERQTQLRLQELHATFERTGTRTLERAAQIWIACGIATYLLGFVILPWLFGSFRR